MADPGGGIATLGEGLAVALQGRFARTEHHQIRVRHPQVWSLAEILRRATRLGVDREVGIDHAQAPPDVLIEPIEAQGIQQRARLGVDRLAGAGELDTPAPQFGQLGVEAPTALAVDRQPAG